MSNYDAPRWWQRTVRSPRGRGYPASVIDFATGGPLGVSKALVRYVGKIISSIPCGLGYFWAIWDKEKQTWHDKIAGTVVVPTADYPVAAWPG